MCETHSLALGSQTGFRPPQKWGPVSGTGGSESCSLNLWSWMPISTGINITKCQYITIHYKLQQTEMPFKK